MTNIINKLQYVWCSLLIIVVLVMSYIYFSDVTGAYNGHELLLRQLQLLPYGDVLFNNLVGYGIILIIFIFIPNLASLILLFLKNHSATSFCFTSSIILVIWSIFEFLLFGFNIQTEFFMFIALLQGVTACYLIINQSDDSL